MKTLVRNLCVLLTVIVMAVTMSVSSFSVAEPASLEATISTTLITVGAGNATTSFKVTSAGTVKIAASVYYVIKANTGSRSLSSYVYLYNSDEELIASIWLNSAYMGNSKSSTLTSLTYTGSKTITLDKGTYYLVASTTGASSAYTGYFSVSL